MSKIYLNKGFDPKDLEKGVEFEVDHADKDSSSDDSFYDGRFDDFKMELSNIGIQPKDLEISFSDLRPKMEPVTEDGHVMKQIVKWGSGPVIPEGALVMAHYDAFLETQKEPFDSTRLRSRAHKFVLGEGNIIPGLDAAIKTMKKEEISKILVESDYAYGSLGCPPRIPGNAAILYIVEILNFYESKEVIEFEEMSPEEQKKAPFNKIVAVFNCEHQMGNELFRNKQYKQAISRYRRMVKLLEDVSVENEDEDNTRNQYLLMLYLNLSQSFINVRNFPKAIIYADLALKLDRNNPKGLYRMGYALFLSDQYDKARFYLNKAKLHKPYERGINSILIDLERKHKQFNDWERKVYKNMFMTESGKGTGEAESSDMIKFHAILEREFKKFLDSSETELCFSPGYTDEEVEVVQELAKLHNLAFVSKVQNNTKIIKVSKTK